MMLRYLILAGKIKTCNQAIRSQVGHKGSGKSDLDRLGSLCKHSLNVFIPILYNCFTTC